MCITDDKLVDMYGQSNPHERFMLIYRNYGVFPKLIDSYEIGLFNRILYEREYNLRAKNGEDLGVRIQDPRVSDPTSRQAIENLMIHETIEKSDFSGDILKYTDTPEKHKRDILTIQMMRREYEIFNTNLEALPEKEYRITCRFIKKESTAVKIAEEEDRAYQTIANLIAVTRKILEQRTVPFFGKTL